jgi:hypothetical protein
MGSTVIVLLAEPELTTTFPPPDDSPTGTPKPLNVNVAEPAPKFAEASVAFSVPSESATVFALDELFALGTPDSV